MENVENTPSEQVNTQQVLDFSSILTPAKAEPVKSEVVAPVVENVVNNTTPELKQEIQNEFIIVDGERIELNLDEVIGSHPDGTPIKLRETDNPKSYKFFQARDSKKEKELKELREMVKSVQKPAEVKADAPPTPPARPVFPQRPKDYDPTEAVTNPDSASYKFEREKEDYYSQKDAYDAYKENELFSFKGQIEAEKQAQLKSQQEIAFQSQMLAQIQEVGAVDVNEAKEIWDTYTAPKDDASFLKELVEFHHFKKGQKTPQTQNKIDQFERNTQRQAQYLPPPGVAPSQSVQEEPDFGKLLLQTTKQYRI